MATSSSREVRRREPDSFLDVNFSRGTLPQKKDSRALLGELGGNELMTILWQSWLFFVAAPTRPYKFG